MKRKLMTIGLLGLLGLSFAAVPAQAAPQRNVQILEEVTGKGIAELGIASGKRLGEIAKEYGKLKEFQEKVRASKKEQLKEAVAQNRITQEQADQRIGQIAQNQENCDGTGNGVGQVDGTGLGMGQGTGRGHGGRTGVGGQRSGNGSCRY